MIDHDTLRALLRNAASVLPTRDRLIFGAMLRGMRPEEERPKRVRGRRKIHSWHKAKKSKPPRVRGEREAGCKVPSSQGDLFDGA